MIDNLIRESTCRVSCGDQFGTGYLISDQNVLTARHCVIPAINSGRAIELTFWGPEGDICITATIIAQSEEMDACILSFNERMRFSQIPLNVAMPREGFDWRSFGYPISKTTIGHRIYGTVSHLLDFPRLKMDIDLTIDPSAALQNYRGLSGAPVVCENTIRGMIRLKVDGTLGAISIHYLESFLAENGIQIQNLDGDKTASTDYRRSLADRSVFQEKFEQTITGNSGDYVFLEGAHGIGKTTFCAEFEPMDRELFILGTYRLMSPERGPGAAYRVQPEVFFDWLLTTVSTLIMGKPSRKEEMSYATLVSEALTLLDAFSKYCISTGRHGVLFLDGLNEAQATDPSALSKLLGLLPTSLPQKVTIVLTAPNYHNLAAPLHGRVKSKNVISLPPLSNDAISAYCLQELKESRATPGLIAQICEKAQGHPLYLRYLIEYANSSTEESALDGFPILTGPIEEYYESLWAQLLEDADAINLLAIVARLRWGIRINDVPKILMLTEQTVFIPTISRIRHLLLNPDTTTIYHPSFTEFLLSKTAYLEVAIQRRLAKFCFKETQLEYCALNVIYHLLRSDEADRSRAIGACTQSWVDECVALGANPDTLLFDIERTLSAAISSSTATEVVRLLLLSQRVTFRYNNLFAQSARLIAEALIMLGKPHEAMKHLIRYKNLIVNPDDALKIALCLIRHEYREEALEILGLLYQKILEAYITDDLKLTDFIQIHRSHLRTLFFMRLAKGGDMMRQVISVLNYGKQVLEANLTEASPDILEEYQARIQCVGTSYFLCFHNTYTSLAKIREMGTQVPEGFLLGIIFGLLECDDSLERYNLSKDISSLPQVFYDIEELLTTGSSIDKRFIPAIVDTLIQLGAPYSVVQLLAENDGEAVPQSCKIKAENGVDIDFESIQKSATDWRTRAFLDVDFCCPLVGAFNKDSWLSSLDQLIRALAWCEGMARRAKADGNDSLRVKVIDLLRDRVMKPLAFTLAQRVKWEGSYAIPESVFPLIYERVTLVFMDCYPKELPEYLSYLINRASDQLGLYSEGFRMVIFSVLRKLTVREIEPQLFEEVFNLLQLCKEHVIRGVENRHELVPELLRLIPLFVKMGANEEAERLYRHMLGVSMGPTWYKEDQLGLMVGVLEEIPSSDNVQEALPLVAGYLERASGEMTFQRFIRYEKAALIGELFRRSRVISGCRYFIRQTCGSMEDLLSEAQHGFIDKPSSMVGMRHPGGALDEQDAILHIVNNAEKMDWRLRWALLEIFQYGDERHLDDYAAEYAKIINQHGTSTALISEMVRRIKFIVGAEIPPEVKNRFAESFRRKLKPENNATFSRVIHQPSTENLRQEENNFFPPKDTPSSKVTSQDEDALYLPGVFGKQSATREADAVLATAEKQLKLGNLQDAKKEAVKMLKLLQDGGWSIWGNLSASAARAEAIILEVSVNAEDVIRAYAPLLEAERHAQKWRIAEHLFAKLAKLLHEEERNKLLQHAIDHVYLMVGDASDDIAMFDFLADEPPCDVSLEVFRFVLWLLDHPKELRREKAAAMVACLVENETIYFQQAVKEAFSMSTGYNAEVICGILDEMSTREPRDFWNRVFDFLDLENVLKNCRHVGRLAVLHRIAQRAGNAGSIKGAEVASRIEGQFRSGVIELGTSDSTVKIPRWANCVSREWNNLRELGLISKELIISLEEELTRIFRPLNLQDAWSLENAVSVSFREPINRPLNRWEAKVRFALNVVLFEYASKRDFKNIELTLRVFNPSLPECTLTPGFASPAETAFKAFTSKDYKGAIGDSEFFFLDYHEIIEREEVDRCDYLEVLAVIVPTSSVRRGFFLPATDTSFRPKEIPELDEKIGSPHETCCHLEPDFAIFGSFTPAFPLPNFAKLVNARESDFLRVNWRNGRSSDSRYFGRPMQEGCLLAIRRTSVHLPDEKKLAWILRLNRKTVAMIDSQNNLLF